MIKKIILSIVGLIIGLFIAYVCVFYTPIFSPRITNIPSLQSINGQKQIIGFLTYWLLDKAKTDYSPYISTLTYFGLRINKDGSIQKLVSPTESEPGWYALESGKVDPFLMSARQHNISLSLLIDSGDTTTIEQLVANPQLHAQTLAQNLSPLIQKYNFSDINMDIEYTSVASDTARVHFTQFLKSLRSDLPHVTLTVEISPTDAIQKNLIDVSEVGQIANYIVLMAYDYHAPDSFVTGPIAPLKGAGTISEYDVITAVQKTYAIVPSQKILLGIPLYGYEWETLGKTPRSAVIPGTGVLASTKRAQELLSLCATCSAQIDSVADEKYVSYFNDTTNTNHLLFFPDSDSTNNKIHLTNTMNLGGLALWALGYEDNSILEPLKGYK